MYCPSCAAENPDGAAFCGSCGKPMPGAQATPSHPLPSGNGKQVSDATKYGVIAASLVIPLIGIGMGLYYLQSDNPARKDVGKLWLGTGIGLTVLYFIMLEGGY